MKLRLLFLFTLFTGISFAQVTGLSGWNIYVDPGHSMKENMGIYNYSEAEKTLRVGLNLRELLLTTTDIDTVWLCRYTDQDNVSLTQRTDDANSKGAAWYHSIHSNAGAASSNSTLLLWGQYRDGREKIPNGGKAMSSFIVDNLTKGYRIPTSGSIGDCSFYGCTGDGPYLHVNRVTTMPSELSEAGYHTNVRQNTLNMNSLWKRMEAKTFYFSILKYKGVQVPFVGTAMGIISDLESDQPLNGAVVTLNGMKDTTDTWSSLFYKYSSDSTVLHNGYYYFENLPAGTYPLTVSAAGYRDTTINVTIRDTFFTFQDVKMISETAPKRISIFPAMNDSLYPGLEHIKITFSRPMNKLSVEQNIVLTPDTTKTFAWQDQDKTLIISSNNLNFSSTYQLKILGSAMDKYGHLFDGNGDGIGGDEYIHTFNTKAQDMQAPVIVKVTPSEDSTNIELQPIISLVFDEQINTATLTGKITVVKASDNTAITAVMKHYVVNGISVINVFPKNLLAENQAYIIKLNAGVQDLHGNPIAENNNFTFSTGLSYYSNFTVIDNFDAGLGIWWQPQQSGGTIGILTDTTYLTSSATIFNSMTLSTKSIMLNYGWDTTASNWLIREYYPSSAPSFLTTKYLQTFVFGDGSGTKFRFCVRDGAGMAGHEVSQWYSIDWYGWRLITWDLANDPIGTWIGNGILDAPLSFDSYQLSFSGNNSKNIGAVYFDDLRLSGKTTVGVNEEGSNEIKTFSLMQNYPNPFNPSTVIKFSIPQEGQVTLELFNSLGQKIKTLMSDFKNAGEYSYILNTNSDGMNLSSGIYFYKLNVTSSSKTFSDTKKFILLK